MDTGQPLFRRVLGEGIFKVFPNEIRYDPLFGKPGDRHWSIPRVAVHDVACEKKLLFYTLRFQTDTATHEAQSFSDSDVLQVISLVLPEKLQTDPLLRELQQRRDDKALREQQRRVDKAFRDQQREYERQLAAYQQSLQPEQLVRTYKHNPEKDFEKDAARLVREGWVVQSQSAGGQKSATLGEMLVLGNARERRVREITVVYTRPRKPLPMPTPPQRPAQTIVPPPTHAPVSLPASDPEPSAQLDLMTQLEKLGELHQKGILTDEEFTAKKADILARM